MKKFKKMTLLVLVFAMVLLTITACGPKETAVTLDMGETGDIKGEIKYPINTDKELSWWMPLNGNVAAVAPSLNETPLAEELEKRTGIKVNFVHPTRGQESENFSLLMASGNTHDITTSSWFSYGPDLAVQQGQIIALNDVMEDYAPNLYKIINESEDLQKMLKTDSGTYYAFPHIKDDASMGRTFKGLMLRQDWLEELGLEVPETIDEWETVLKAFKEKKGAKAPLTLASTTDMLISRLFIGAYDLDYNYYVEDGKMVYGPVYNREGFREFLTRMNKWYNEGLLDKNIATNDKAMVDSNMLNDDAGATYGFASSGMSVYLDAKKDDPNFKLVAAKFPVLKKGDICEFGFVDSKYHTGNSAAAIGAKSVNKALAMRLLDYLYTEEGHIFANCGIEGVTYEKVNGEIKPTDFVLNNPEGKTVSQLMSLYSFGTYEAPRMSNDSAFMSRIKYPEVVEATKTWAISNQKDHERPAITMTTAENEEFRALDGEIYTYVNQMVTKFIVGIEPLSKFDDFIAELEKRGAERCAEILDTAMQRYNAR